MGNDDGQNRRGAVDEELLLEIALDRTRRGATRAEVSAWLAAQGMNPDVAARSASQLRPVAARKCRGDAIALAYAGYRDAGWGLGASVQIARGVSASFDYGELAGRSKGFVLLFDEQWRLEGVRSGYLRDLRGPIQRPMPQAME